MPVIHANTKPLILGVRTIAAAEDGRSIIAMTLKAARQATASGWLWHCQPDITSRARDSWAARRAAVAATQKQIAGLRAAQRSQNTPEKPSFRTTHRLRCPHDGSRLPPRPIEPRGDVGEGLRSAASRGTQSAPICRGRGPRASQHLTGPYRAFDQRHVPIAVKAA
jgi:hypothetical protein